MGMFAKVKQIIEAARIISRNAESFTRGMSSGMESAEEVFYRTMARLTGKQVAILGPKGAGKTTLLKVFRDPTIPGASLRTYSETEAEDVDSFQSTWTIPTASGKEISYSFKFRRGKDVGGETIYREQYWLHDVKSAEVVFYVAEWDGLLGGDKSYLEKMEDDFRWFGRQVNQMRPNSRIVVLFNKVDKYCPSNAQYDYFVDSHGDKAREVLDRMRSQLPRSYRHKLAGYVFTSFTDELIRNECFVGIIEAVMGDRMRELVTGEVKARREREKKKDDGTEEAERQYRIPGARHREGAYYAEGS